MAFFYSVWSTALYDPNNLWGYQVTVILTIWRMRNWFQGCGWCCWLLACDKQLRPLKVYWGYYCSCWEQVVTLRSLLTYFDPVVFGWLLNVQRLGQRWGKFIDNWSVAVGGVENFLTIPPTLCSKFLGLSLIVLCIVLRPCTTQGKPRVLEVGLVLFDLICVRDFRVLRLYSISWSISDVGSQENHLLLMALSSLNNCYSLFLIHTGNRQPTPVASIYFFTPDEEEPPG